MLLARLSMARTKEEHRAHALLPRSAPVRHRLCIRPNRDLLRRILKEHVADDARQMLAKRVVVEHLELSGFEIDEERQVMRKKPPTHGRG